MLSRSAFESQPGAGYWLKLIEQLLHTEVSFLIASPFLKPILNPLIKLS